MHTLTPTRARARTRVAGAAVALFMAVGASCAAWPSGNPTAAECATVRHAVATGAPADYVGAPEGQSNGVWLLHDAQRVIPSGHEGTCWGSPYCAPTDDDADAWRWTPEAGTVALGCPVPHPYLP